MKRIKPLPLVKLPPLPEKYGTPDIDALLPRIARRPRKDPAGLRHPLIVGLTRAQKKLGGVSLRHLALQHLGVTQQALDEWFKEALKDEHYPLPPLRVPSVSKLTGIPPYYFNPVLWPTPEWRFHDGR